MPLISRLTQITTTRIALLTGIGCVACCTLPWLAIALGSSTLAGLAAYSEKAALALAALGLVVWAIRKRRAAQGPHCTLDCNQQGR